METAPSPALREPEGPPGDLPRRDQGPVDPTATDIRPPTAELLLDRLFPDPSTDGADILPPVPPRAEGPPPLANWASLVQGPCRESDRSRWSARTGGLVAIAALTAYLVWRIGFTLPADGWDRNVAWLLVLFEAVPLAALIARTITVWDIDCHAPAPVTEHRPGSRVAVLIPTYNEPVEVIAPTIAAACALEPVHETWVLDDGDRDWVASLCEAYGARYVTRPVHDHAKAGNLNHALDLMAEEAAEGGADFDVIASLDCDHVPLPHFLTATLGWFDDPEIALVQGPQTYYNAGAFDDDGVAGDQGIFFHVLMAARNDKEAGPFWCGSTALLRLRALREVGGVATETITEDMHTTLRLVRSGWRTAYHHQALAVGLGPGTSEQYLLQRRRWGMGAMQVLAAERLWAAKGWLSWRSYYEYLAGALWWLEGITTLLMFVVPASILLSGAQVSTAPVSLFVAIFGTTFALRLWGVTRLFRHHLHLPTSYAMRVFRIPIGLSCLWWLVTRRTLKFEVTPKAAADARLRGRVPRILWVTVGSMSCVLGYSALGLAGQVPWRSNAEATVASGIWLVLGAAALFLGTSRIRAADYASSRRNAHRVAVHAPVAVDGVDGELVDVSVGGVAVRLPVRELPVGGGVTLVLPAAPPMQLELVRAVADPSSGGVVASLQVAAGDWAAHRALSLWMFHTPEDALAGWPRQVPVVAASPAARSARVHLVFVPQGGPRV